MTSHNGLTKVTCMYHRQGAGAKNIYLKWRQVVNLHKLHAYITDKVKAQRLCTGARTIYLEWRHTMNLHQLLAYTIDKVQAQRIFILNDVTQWTCTNYYNNWDKISMSIKYTNSSEHNRPSISGKKFRFVRISLLMFLIFLDRWLVCVIF